MTQVRIIQIGPNHTTLITNVVLTLGRLQTGFDIYQDDDIVMPDMARGDAAGRFHDEYFFELLRKHMYEKKFSEFPIGVTDYPFHEEVFTSTNGEVAVISLHGWDEYSRFPLDKGLEYLIAATLMDLTLDMDIHYDTRGCPNDYCDDLKEINLGLAKAEYCEDCKRIILGGLETSELSITDTASIYRILDRVAQRTVAFVLIPFLDEFEDIYTTIRNAMNDRRIQCFRADEIFRPTAIIDTINEMIIRADLIVADLTGKNPNVFYELGYAHALGKATILLTQNPGDVPFDLRHRLYILYSDSQELARALPDALHRFR